jgi:hypothetical protein
MEQRITGLRLIWPDDLEYQDSAREIATRAVNEVEFSGSAMPMGTPATVYGRSARRYAHLAVIDGGRV